MKTKHFLLALLGLSTLSSQLPTAFAQSTAFTYQGRLNDGANPASGSYDLTFSLWNAASGPAQVGSTLTNTATLVSNALFTVTLDFGNQFPGVNRWLEIAVRTNGGGAFSTLAPRQALTPTPYAMFANTSSNLAGTLPLAQLPAGVVTNGASAVNLSGTFTGNGAGVTNVNAATFGGLNAGTFWQLGGNNVSGGQFLGSTNSQPLEFKVNGLRALRIENPGDSAYDGGTTPDGAPNLIGGSPRNFVGAGVVGATIAGGGATNYNGSAHTNSVLADFGVVGGGLRNIIAEAAAGAIIAGGNFNDISTNSYSSAIGGGGFNSIAANSGSATIAGGQFNDIGTNSEYGAIGGGYDNNIGANSFYAIIAGGYWNDIGTNSDYSAIGGGGYNKIAAGSAAATIAGGNANNIAAASWYATIAGGQSNDIGTNSDYSAIGGGYENNIAANSPRATIAGGYWNDIGMNSAHSAIGGGHDNNIAADARYDTIAGGLYNEIGTNSDVSVIGGGYYNKIAANASYATIPGGHLNAATNYAFAAGRRAKANHTGAFVWADSTDADFASTADHQFLLRASGGVGIGLANPAAQLEVSSGGGDSFPQTRINQTNVNDYARLRFTVGGDVNKRWDFASRSNVFVIYSGQTGSEALRLENNNAYVNGAVVLTSDRNAKADFAGVDAQEVLEKVAALPLQSWSYTNRPGVKHVGPMAQDFRAAFGLGEDDKHIATVDADGVALAAIQGLNQKVEAENASLRSELQRRAKENAELKARLERLERLLSESSHQ